MFRKTIGYGLRTLALSMIVLTGCTGGEDAADQVSSAEGETAAMALEDGLPQRLEAYVAALNAGDVAQLFAFYEDGVTASYRERRSEEEDRALYATLTEDLGRVEIETIDRESDARVTLVARAERKEVPVRFVFDIKDERIDGVSIRLGGPPPGPGAGLVKLPRGIDDDGLARALDDQLAGLAANDRFSGAVLLARNGEAFFEGAYGLADRAAGRANTVSTVFDIGSITKLITRTAIAQLLQEKKIALDGRIADYLPDYPNSQVAEAVTVQHLLDHSSGLGDIFNSRWRGADKAQYIEPRDFFALFADEELLFTPGSRRQYSNAGFVVLGAIVEAVAGEPFAQYVENQIFVPAGMSQSGFELRDGTNSAHAIGYAPMGEGGTLVSNLDMLPVQGCPAGSSMHTAADLLKLDRALRDGTLLDPGWTAWLFHSPVVLPGAGYSIGVAGGAPGVSAGLESNGAVTAIVLSNFDPPNGEALARELFAAISDEAPGVE